MKQCGNRNTFQQLKDRRGICMTLEGFSLSVTFSAWALRVQDGLIVTNRRVWQMCVCLDRCVASPEWSEHFKEAFVEHICSSRSDHLPVLVQFGGRKVWKPVGGRPRGPVRYEQMWERSSSLQDTIAAVWGKKGQVKNL